ncbi:MAG: NADH-quinone oxidoreductase subunit I [Candidatus Omnitrophica bacterium]|nr:NADH-quinone oxidoreductase subunit I [Candidatus Omnitrophota bacterium]
MFKMITYVFSGLLSILKGLGITWNNMFRKAVTLQYPLQKPVMTERFRGLVDLIPEKCIACSQCVKICPTAALDLTSAVNPETKKKSPCTFVFNGELCCFCGLCQEVCPTSAIFLNNIYEAAYYKHEDMLKIDLLKVDKYAHLAPKKACPCSKTSETRK